MKYVKSQNGNTLVIAVFILTIATVIALTLISLSMNGITRNEHRENYNQAKQRAEDGITHIMSYMENELVKIIPPPSIGSSMSIDTFKSDFSKILKEYDCSKKI